MTTAADPAPVQPARFVEARRTSACAVAMRAAPYTGLTRSSLLRWILPPTMISLAIGGALLATGASAGTIATWRWVVSGSLFAIAAWLLSIVVRHWATASPTIERWLVAVEHPKLVAGPRRQLPMARLHREDGESHIVFGVFTEAPTWRHGAIGVAEIQRQRGEIIVCNFVEVLAPDAPPEH